MENLHQYKVNNVQLHYFQSGAGSPLVFIPGSISDYRTWLDISKRFESKHTCYVLSRRFQYPARYPLDGVDSDSSLAANTSDIFTFINEKNIKPVTLIAHSFGGFIALNLAIKYPQLIKAVVAADPIFAPALVSNPKNPLQLIGLMLRNFKAGKSFARMGIKGVGPAFKAAANGGFSTAKKTFIDGLTEGKKTPETLDEVTRIQLDDNIATLATEDPFDNKLKLSDAEQISCNVLLISSSDSPFFFNYINDELEKRITGGKHITIQNAAHWSHLDQPDKFVEVVEGFIK